MEFIPGGRIAITTTRSSILPSAGPSTLPTPPMMPRLPKDTLEEDILMINHTHITMKMVHNFVEQNSKTDITLLDEFKQHASLFLDEEAKPFPPS